MRNAYKIIEKFKRKKLFETSRHRWKGNIKILLRNLCITFPCVIIYIKGIKLEGVD
jgi:hypothetical protein